MKNGGKRYPHRQQGTETGGGKGRTVHICGLGNAEFGRRLYFTIIVQRGYDTRVKERKDYCPELVCKLRGGTRKQKILPAENEENVT